MIELNHKKRKTKESLSWKGSLFVSVEFLALGRPKNFHIFEATNMKNINISPNLKLPIGIPSDLFKSEIVLFHFYLCSYIILKSHLAGPSGIISKYLQVWQHSKHQMR